MAGYFITIFLPYSRLFCRPVLTLLQQPSQQFLGLLHLLGGQLDCHEILGFQGLLVALGRGEGDQDICLDEILIHPITHGIQAPEIKLGVGIALFGGLAEPHCRLPVIPGQAFAQGIHQPEIILGVGLALFGPLAVPDDRLTVIIRYMLGQQEIMLGRS